MENLMFLGYLFFPIVMLAFIITVLLIPVWIKRAHKENLVGRDINKLDKRKVAEGGGIPVFIGFVISVFLYIALKTFLFKDNRNLIETLALICVLFFATSIGAVDDLLGWKKGLSKKTRIILLIFCAIPFMVISAGSRTIFGVDIGLLAPLVIVPLGIIGATSTYNFLAGYNGLEASQGILILMALAIVMFIGNNLWLSLICCCMIAALIAFLLFNKYPAKIFPGDSLTYCIGAVIACIAILGNAEKIALFLFIPYILEVILKLRGKLKKESFAKVNSYGGLEEPYDKIYGLEHLALRILKNFKNGKKINEWEVTLLINSFQILIIALAFLIFL